MVDVLQPGGRIDVLQSVEGRVDVSQPRGGLTFCNPGRGKERRRTDVLQSRVLGGSEAVKRLSIL